MRPLSDWLREYAEGHQHPLNVLLHKICVPVIFFSVIGFITSMPWKILNINVSDLIIFIAMIRYLAFGRRAFGIMFVFTSLSMILIHNLRIKVGFDNMIYILLLLFILAWVGQFVGHKIEGKKPSFFKDLQFLLVGPLWLFKRLLH